VLAPPPIPLPPPPTRTEFVADQAIDRAFRSVLAHDRGCRIHGDRPPPVIAGSPPSAIRRGFGVLRGGESALAEFTNGTEWLPDGIYADSVRRVRRLTGGYVLYVLATRSPPAHPVPMRCDREELARLRELLRDRPAVLRFALRRDRRRQRARRRRLARASVSVCAQLRDRYGSLEGGCLSVAAIRHGGVGSGLGPHHIAFALVPDGVATIDAYDINTRTRRILHIRRRVRHNVIAYHEPRFTDHLVHYGDVWRGPGGRIVNTVCELGCYDYAPRGR
jgi:hypothetical protein